MRVVESNGNPVRGATVKFQWLVVRPAAGDTGISIGDTNLGHKPIPVVLASLQANVTSEADGIAGIRPTTAGFSGALLIQGTVAVGSSLPFEAHWIGP